MIMGNHQVTYCEFQVLPGISSTNVFRLKKKRRVICLMVQKAFMRSWQLTNLGNMGLSSIVNSCRPYGSPRKSQIQQKSLRKKNFKTNCHLFFSETSHAATVPLKNRRTGSMLNVTQIFGWSIHRRNEAFEDKDIDRIGGLHYMCFSFNSWPLVFCRYRFRHEPLSSTT